jgi:hypothetical protein
VNATIHLRAVDTPQRFASVELPSGEAPNDEPIPASGYKVPVEPDQLVENSYRADKDPCLATHPPAQLLNASKCAWLTEHSANASQNRQGGCG